MIKTLEPHRTSGTCTGLIGPYQRYIIKSAKIYEKFKSIVMHPET